MYDRIVVYSPQIWENYTLQSGQGLSVMFVLIWLVGDACSLTGGLIAHLVPTVIILAIYVSTAHSLRQAAKIQRSPHQYLFCDSLLLFQIYYYRWKNPHADEVITQEIETTEDTPLLGNSVEPKRTSRWSMENEVLKYSVCLILVFAAGVLAWAIDSKARGPRPPNEPEGIVEWKSQILGWVSAVLFRTSSTLFNFAFCSTHPR